VSRKTASVVRVAVAKMIPSVLRACSLRVGMRGELAHEELEVAFYHGEIGSGLVDLPQCELVLICHINRHQRSTFANPRNSRNLRRCPLVSSKCEWPTSVLA
jgi:hypothetical protein